ncbi:MAG: class I SAM-dependent methyltransferase, partial [Elusimicrobiota bacterium]
LVRNMSAGYALRHPLSWLAAGAGARLRAMGSRGGGLKRLIEKTASSERLTGISAGLRPAFFRRLGRRLDGVPRAPKSGVWLEHARDNPAGPKLKAVSALLESLRPGSVIDLGCNTGEFSVLAAKLGACVTALDSDESCIDALHGRAHREDLKILPLVADALNPTPAFGSMSDQFPSMLERLEADCVLCLGLMHHLHVAGGQSFPRIAALLSRLGRCSAVFEFIAADDANIRLLHHGKDIRYSMEDATRALAAHFKLEILDSDRPTRKLVLCRR